MQLYINVFLGRKSYCGPVLSCLTTTSPLNFHGNFSKKSVICKVVPELPLVAYGGRGGTSVIILNLGRTRW